MSRLELELTDVAGSRSDLRECADGFLGVLRRFVPFDAAWMAVADTHHPRYSTVADTAVDDVVLEHLLGPVNSADIEATGTNRRRPPLSPSDLPYPCEELQTWAECLVPAGFHEALAVALFEPGGRHVGFLALLYGQRDPPSPDWRSQLARAAPVLGRSLDPLRSLASVARIVVGASAGVVLLAGEGVAALPGLDPDPLLLTGGCLLAVARRHLAAGHTCTSFLWPTSEVGPAHVRATVLAATPAPTTQQVGVVVLSPAPDTRGLTPRELEVLGHLVEGRSNQEISHRLVLAPRTVAAHVEHILTKLEASTRTLAAVRACREGLYVPVAASDTSRRTGAVAG